MSHGACMQLKAHNADDGTNESKVQNNEAGTPKVSGYYKIESCPMPECLDLVSKHIGDPWTEHGYFTRQGIESMNTLPPYVIERYVRILNIWRNRRHQVCTLFELCARRVNSLGISLSPWLLPRRNHIIHRVFGRMLSVLNEAVLYESVHHSGRIFEQYICLSCSPLQGWMNRNEYLQKVKCPLHRFIARLHIVRNPTSIARLHAPEFPDDDIDRYVRPHQCGYTRCTCNGYVDIRPPSMSLNKARMRMRLGMLADQRYVVYIPPPKKKEKVPKVKLQADRAERQARKR